MLFFIFPCFLQAWTDTNAAYEDDTSDQNGKPSTPAHLTSSTSTIITTRENLHLAITSVLRMLHLPRDQQFCLGLNRTAFFWFNFVFLSLNMFKRASFLYLIYVPFLHPSVLPQAQQSYSLNPFLVAWPVHNLLITLPASHQLFCFSLNTVSAS